MNEETITFKAKIYHDSGIGIGLYLKQSPDGSGWSHMHWFPLKHTQLKKDNDMSLVVEATAPKWLLEKMNVLNIITPCNQ